MVALDGAIDLVRNGLALAMPPQPTRLLGRGELGSVADVICADMSDEDSVERLARRFDKPPTTSTSWSTTRAYCQPHSAWRTSPGATGTKLLTINLISPWYLACRAKELMAPAGGIIVNIASTAAFFPSAGLAPYKVSKAGLVMFTKVCALEWASANVRVLGVAPGKVSTDMVASILDWTRSKSLDVNPLGRGGGSVEVAKLVAYLVSDDAAYVTGAVVTIDVGELLTFGR